MALARLVETERHHALLGACRIPSVDVVCILANYRLGLDLENGSWHSKGLEVLQCAFIQILVAAAFKTKVTNGNTSQRSVCIVSGRSKRQGSVCCII